MKTKQLGYSDLLNDMKKSAVFLLTRDEINKLKTDAELAAYCNPGRAQ